MERVTPQSATRTVTMWQLTTMDTAMLYQDQVRTLSPSIPSLCIHTSDIMYPLTGSDGKSCAGVTCPALPYAGCVGVTPWDACCPKCGT